MKRILFVMMVLLAGPATATQQKSNAIPSDLMQARSIFKNNLMKNENFAQLLASMTDEIRADFNEMVDGVWSLFCKMHTYCIEHLKGNPLFEKYKQFMQKKSIKGTVLCSLEDREDFDFEKLCKRGSDENFELALQPFCETLSEQEQVQFKELMQKLSFFFDELRIEYEQMLDEYASVEEAFAKALENYSKKIVYIECGLEYPFPTFAYYID